VSDGDHLFEAVFAVGARFLPHFEGATVERRDGYVVSLTPALPYPTFNGVTVITAECDAVAGDQLPSLVGQIEAAGVAMGVGLRDGLSPLTDAVARRLGFTARDNFEAMVWQRDAARTVRPDLVSVRPATVDDLGTLFGASYDTSPEFTEILIPASMLEGGDVAFLLAHAGETPVSMMCLIQVGDDVGLYNVGTPPEYRRHGYASAMIATALRDIDAGLFVFLLASPAVAGVYRRVGFETVERCYWLTRPASEG
jgi:N-acetylglutamate synthase